VEIARPGHLGSESHTKNAEQKGAIIINLLLSI